MIASLTPLGTVKRRLGAPEPKATPYPDALLAALRERNLGNETLYVAWELSRCAVSKTPLEREALLVATVASLVALEEGSTYVPVSELGERLRALGVDDERVATAEKLLTEENEIVGRPGAYKPLIVDDGKLYHQKAHVREQALARRVKARLEQKSDRSAYPKILDALDRVLAHRPLVGGKDLRLSTEQQHAVRTALTRALTVVSGGPGTGKTFVVASILRVLARLAFPLDRVALAAPTGRAARRMAESVELVLRAVPEPKIVDASVLETLVEPRTLHRLLGYSPAAGFRYGEDRRLPYRFVIVDEASMIDLELMDRLLAALRPEGRLVLLGDPAQLPPVGAGAVFSEIVTAGHERASVELHEGYRVDPQNAAGRNLAAAFRALRGGNLAELAATITVRARASDVELRGVELLPEDRDAFLDRWFEECMSSDYRELAAGANPDASAIFAHLRRYRILTATSADAERINKRFRRRNRGRPGEPVIVLVNDYERGLFNGELGFVGRGGVRFETAGADARPGDVVPAYAITVHKSQGSELDHIALVLPRADHPLLTRELLYTAMTRARKSVTLLGSLDALTGGAARTPERHTGILARLA